MHIEYFCLQRFVKSLNKHGLHSKAFAWRNLLNISQNHIQDIDVLAFTMLRPPVYPLLCSDGIQQASTEAHNPVTRAGHHQPL
ncbi:Uncharacterised protein [Yersinia intermedia]|nr:Uncharacterised protein [Yersinia intermedia]